MKINKKVKSKIKTWKKVRAEKYKMYHNIIETIYKFKN